MSQPEPTQPNKIVTWAVGILGAIIVAGIVGYMTKVSNTMDTSIELRSDLKVVRADVDTIKGSMRDINISIQALSQNFVSRAEYDRAQQRLDQRLDRLENQRK